MYKKYPVTCFVWKADFELFRTHNTSSFLMHLNFSCKEYSCIEVDNVYRAPVSMNISWSLE